MGATTKDLVRTGGASPMGGRKEFIAPDPEYRQDSVINMTGIGGRRVYKYHTYALEILRSGKPIGPYRLRNEYAIGEVIKVDGRCWTIHRVCDICCEPTRLSPVRDTTDDGPLPARQAMDCVRCVYHPDEFDQRLADLEAFRF